MDDVVLNVLEAGIFVIGIPVLEIGTERNQLNTYSD